MRSVIHLGVDDANNRWESLELSCVPSCLKQTSFLKSSSHPVMAMNAAKRRRNKSMAATPIMNQSNDSHASSFIQSSPLCHLQRTKHLQQRPAQRIGLHLPKTNPHTSVLTSTIHPNYRRPHLSSAAASSVDVVLEDKSEREPEEDADPDEVIMCVDMRERGTVGCCYYESFTGDLHLVEDVRCGGLDVIDTRECVP